MHVHFSSRCSTRPSASRNLALIFVGALAIVPLTSCGGDQAAAGTTDAAVARTDVPIQGKSVSGSKQLLGTWMRVTPGEFTGLEFGKEDRVLMTVGKDSKQVTASYELLEGGRLSIVGALGMTEVFRTELAGDALELTSESSGDPAQRFTRLPSGQTLAQGLQAQQDQFEEERALREQAFRTQLLAKDFALEHADAAGPRWRMSLDQAPQEAGVSGTLLLEVSSDAADARPAVHSLRFEARFEALGELSSDLAVTLAAAPAVPPLFEAPITGSVTLALQGPVDRPTAKGVAHFPALSQSPVNVVAKRDASALAELVKRLEEQAAHESRVLDELADVLGGEIQTQGKRIIDGPRWRQNNASAKLWLEGEGLHQYTALVGIASNDELPARAALAMFDERAALFLTLPDGEQWRLQPDGDALRGTWRPHAGAEFGVHGDESLQLDLAIVHRTSREDAAATSKALTQFWNVDLEQGMHFTGRLEAVGQPYYHASVEVRTLPDGRRTATVWLPTQRGGGVLVIDGTPALYGTPGRDSAGLTTASWMEARSALDVPAPRSGVLQLFTPFPTLGLDLEWDDGMTLSGHFSAVDGAAYQVAEDAFFASLQDKTFSVGMAKQVIEASVRFRTLEDRRSIEAELLGEAPGLWAHPASPGVFRGAIVNDHFIPVLRGIIDPGADSGQAPVEIELVQTYPNPQMGVGGWTVPSEALPQQIRFSLAPPR